MTRAPTRTPFHSSGLLRTLTELALLQAPVTGPAFAEKLGLWVDCTHAIDLHAVHSAPPSKANDHAGKPLQASTAATARSTFAHQRNLLEHSIGSAKMPPVERAEMSFEPYRRYYLGQQRELELKVPPLRSRARDMLAQASPALRQLAALDAAFEGVLMARESRLLATLPQLLKQRFTQLSGSPDPLQPDAWLLRFRAELQAVLLAELDLRLQPALGLIEALDSELLPELSSEPTPPPCTV